MKLKLRLCSDISDILALNILTYVPRPTKDWELAPANFLKIRFHK